MQFGKEESEERVPQLGMGLLRGEPSEKTEREILKERFARGERISSSRSRTKSRE